jgi:hypothetical protein
MASGDCELRLQSTAPLRHTPTRPCRVARLQHERLLDERRHDERCTQMLQRRVRRVPAGAHARCLRVPLLLVQLSGFFGIVLPHVACVDASRVAGFHGGHAKGSCALWGGAADRTLFWKDLSEVCTPASLKSIGVAVHRCRCLVRRCAPSWTTRLLRLLRRPSGRPNC